MRHSTSALRPDAAAGAGPAAGGEAAATGAGEGPGAGGAFAGAGAGFFASAPSLASISATTLPSDNASPTLTFHSLTTPASGEGTSIVALSDSSVTRPWSFFTASPTATSSSITG